MNGMKKLLLTTIAILVAAGVFALLLNLTKNDIQNQVNQNGGIKPRETSAYSKAADASAAELPEIEQDYLFMTYHKNLSYNADISGFIIDKNGKRYDYKLYGNSKELSPEETLEKVIAPGSLPEGTDYISDFDIHNLYNVSCDINTNAGVTSEGSAGENGTTTLYALRYSEGKPSLIKIYSYGDIRENPTDASALAIQKYFIKKINADEAGTAASIDE